MTPHEVAELLRTRWQQRATTSDAVWPQVSWYEVCSTGVTSWMIPKEYGGTSLSPHELLTNSVELARGDLLTTFILSQFQAACQRIAAADSPPLRQQWLPGLATGELFATVGISHLTTSRQYAAQPAVTAKVTSAGYVLSGEVPWVTGGSHADVLVIGGTLDDGRQILAAVPTDREGVTCADSMSLLALSGSETGPVVLTDVLVAEDELIAGPIVDVIRHVSTGGAGSLTTSALAIGHAWAGLDFLSDEAAQRPALEPIATALMSEVKSLRADLLQAAESSGLYASPEQLRTRATDLALRTSQALLTASKGAGFVVGHSAERLSREALFFLVWSCPQAVANQLLHNFGGCENG